MFPYLTQLIGRRTFDVNCACAAWVAGLDIAAKQISTDSDINKVLVIGGYNMTRFINYHH